MSIAYPGPSFRSSGAAVLAFALLLSACGDDGQPAPTPSSPTPIATTSDIAVSAQRTGTTPFTAFVDLSASGTSVSALSEIAYTIEPMAGTVSRPISVSYTIDSLRNRGRIVGSTVTLPVFGLYAGRSNTVTINARFTDRSTKTLSAAIVTPNYTSANPFRTPTVNTRRSAGSSLGFDYVLMKPGAIQGAPVTIVDTDGNIRWVSVTPAGAAVLFRDNGIDIGDTAGPLLRREELDGSTSTVTVQGRPARRLWHDFDLGPSGILMQPDFTDREEDMLIEVAPDGSLVKTWDLIQIIGDYMRSQGDDPTNFVRYGADWFHMNSAIYDSRDRSLIVSSRENFVIKIDYDTGAIKWILGDPDKYWHSFASLRAKALAIGSGGLVPIGQHALSILPDGQLMMFNNGYRSLNTPVGASTGTSRTFSAVTAFRIDSGTMTATPGFTFEDNRALFSPICSSAYKASDGSMLVTYSQTENGVVLRLKALDARQQVAFDYSYPTQPGCVSSWNSVMVPLENLRFTR